MSSMHISCILPLLLFICSCTATKRKLSESDTYPDFTQPEDSLLSDVSYDTLSAIDNPIESTSICPNNACTLPAGPEKDSSAPTNPVPTQYFADIKDTDFYKMNIKTLYSFSAVSNAKSYRVIWVGIIKKSKTLTEISNTAIDIFGSNVSYIFQWIEETELNSWCSSQSFSSLLAGTPIKKYSRQFLLFVDPSASFLASSRQGVTPLYTRLSSIISNYPSLYFLHRSEIKHSNSLTQPNVHYNLLLHQNIKHYGVVSLSSTMSISLSKLLRNSKPSMQQKYSLDTLIIYSKCIRINIQNFNLLTCFGPMHLDVSCNIWRKIEIDANTDTAQLNTLTVRDIQIDLFSVSNVSSTGPTPTQSNTNLSSNYVKDILYSFYYSHEKLFSYSYSFASYLHLHLVYPNPITLTYSHISTLMFISSFFFFNTSCLIVHLPAHIVIDVFGIQQQIERAMPACNLHQSIEQFIAKYCNTISSHSGSSPSTTASYSIVFKKFRKVNRKSTANPLLISLAALYNVFDFSGYVLASSSLTAFTITNEKVSHSFSVSANTLLDISFESRAQSLFFRSFGLIGSVS